MLRLEHLNKTFMQGTVNARGAAKDVSLELGNGDFLTFIGGNGAGKSTLFALISGVILPDSGRVLLDGDDITYWPEHRRAQFIGRLMQDPLAGTAPSMTIEENISLAYLRAAGRHALFGMSRKEKQFAREKLATLGLGLEDRMGTRVGLLSGGERQAVSLVMATIVTPKLLLLDEHTAALDPQTAEVVLRITRELVARDGITTMMITHNITAALALGNRTVMMDEGEIVLELSQTQREGLSVEDLLSLFAAKRQKQFDYDKALL